MNNNFIISATKQFAYYKLLGEKTFNQLSDEKLFWQYNEESNSIAMIINHLWGNMLSRWTDFLTTDGEKPWRNRDAEFQNNKATKDEIINKWNDGWNCLFTALSQLTAEDLSKEIYIRNQGQTVVDAINRQLCHYSYHIGQIVFIGKMICNESWVSLSIPKGNSSTYNQMKFAQIKHTEHFTDELLQHKKSV